MIKNPVFSANLLKIFIKWDHEIVVSQDYFFPLTEELIFDRKISGLGWLAIEIDPEIPRLALIIASNLAVKVAAVLAEPDRLKISVLFYICCLNYIADKLASRSSRDTIESVRW